VLEFFLFVLEFFLFVLEHEMLTTKLP